MQPEVIKVETGIYTIKLNSAVVGEVEKVGNHWEASYKMSDARMSGIAGHKNTWDKCRFKTRKIAVQTAVDMFIKSKKYLLAELESMPTIHSGHFYNMKIDTGKVTVSLSRMTVADGMPYDNQVTVQELQNGVWVTVAEYEAKDTACDNYADGICTKYSTKKSTFRPKVSACAKFICGGYREGN